MKTCVSILFFGLLFIACNSKNSSKKQTIEVDSIVVNNIEETKYHSEQILVRDTTMDSIKVLLFGEKKTFEIPYYPNEDNPLKTFFEKSDSLKCIALSKHEKWYSSGSFSYLNLQGVIITLKKRTSNAEWRKRTQQLTEMLEGKDIYAFDNLKPGFLVYTMENTIYFVFLSHCRERAKSNMIVNILRERGKGRLDVFTCGFDHEIINSFD